MNTNTEVSLRRCRGIARILSVFGKETLGKATGCLSTIAMLTVFAGVVAKAEDATPTEDRAPIVLSDRATELHRRSLLIDGHNDMPWEIRKQGSSNFAKLDIAKLQP